MNSFFFAFSNYFLPFLYHVSGKVFLTFLITKSISEQFEASTFAKIFFYSDIITWSSTLNLRSFSLLKTSKLIYVLDLTSIGFIMISLWYILLYLSNISCNLSMHTFFDIAVIYLKIFFFKVPINLSATTYFPSFCISFYISLIYCNTHYLNLPINCLVYDKTRLKNYWIALVFVIALLSFKGATHTFLLKILGKHIKNRIPLLHLLFNYIPARSTPHMLPLKQEYAFF